MLTVKIKTDNDAFQDGNAVAELSRLLDVVKGRMKQGHKSGNLLDYNGTTVGSWKLTGR